MASYETAAAPTPAGTAAATSGTSAGEDGTTATRTKGPAMYHCDYCRIDITQQLRVRCAECNDFDLCLSCFSKGRVLDSHLPSHQYRIIEHVRKPIFEQGWGADEELLLLEAIEICGFGNWSDIAEHVGTKSKTECEDHYSKVYLTNSQQQKEIDKVNNANAVANASANRPKPKSGLAQLVGYIPNRGDFDTEYENDAEVILADMEFRDEDSKWERELKLKVLEIYNTKLDARLERKKFILERGLLERKEKKRSKEEREIANNLRCFARFHSADEHDALISGLANEARLRRRIEQLQRWRLNGCKTLREGELFEAERRKREAEKDKEKKKRERDGHYLNIPTTGASNLAPYGDSSAKKSRFNDSDSSISSMSMTAIDPSQPQSRKTASGFSIDQLDGAELLSQKERALCIQLQLLPSHYLLIKERIIRECLLRGMIRENNMKNLLKIDISKSKELIDFFVSVGWVNVHERIAQHASANNLPTAAASGPSSSTS